MPKAPRKRRIETVVEEAPSHDGNPAFAAYQRQFPGDPIRPLWRRERNRTAAAKFRAKSKVAKEELKETERAERDLNSALHTTMHELKAESLLLKHELLRHSGCDNLAINNYLCRAADQINRAVDTLTSTPKANSPLQNV